MKKNLLAIFFLAAYFTSYSQAGSVDPSFGTAGVVTTTFGSVLSTCKSIAIHADGKIVIVGSSLNANGNDFDFGIARFNVDGSPDNSFDGDGIVTTAISTSDDEANAVAIQTDGKIVVAGYTHLPGSGDVFAIARYNTNGTLDNSFDGNGILITDFGLTAEINAIVLQPDGRIIVAGRVRTGANIDFALARYNANGSLDNSFDGDGQLTTSFTSFNDEAFALALQSDGKIVVAGKCGEATSSDIAVARYNPDGSLDNSFNATGQVITVVGNASDLAGLAIQADGKIIVAGGDGDNFVLLRYNSNGSPDNSFDADGKVTTVFNTSSSATSIILQPDGKIVAAGQAFANPIFDFALARYNANGSLDNSFDGDGKLTMNINGDDFATAMKLSGQRIYVGGISNSNLCALVAYQTGSIVLPLQLTSFIAFKENNGIVLNWQTANEQNTSHFDIEHSTDGIYFSKIGQVQASGNSSSLRNYSFTHQQATGLNYYRLKMLDTDGQFTYSKVVIVKMNSEVTLEIFPNPVLDVLQVQLAAVQNETIGLQLLDATGKIIKQQTITSGGNRVSTVIDVSALSKGIYFLVVKKGTGKTVNKIIKQ